MNKSTLLTMCVQTCVMKSSRWPNRNDLSAIVFAGSLPEEHIPMDVVQAAREIYRWKVDGMPIPIFAQEYLESIGEIRKDDELCPHYPRI